MQRVIKTQRTEIKPRLREREWKTFRGTVKQEKHFKIIIFKDGIFS